MQDAIKMKPFIGRNVYITIGDLYFRCISCRVFGSEIRKKSHNQKNSKQIFLKILTKFFQYKKSSLLCKTLSNMVQTHEKLWNRSKTKMSWINTLLKTKLTSKLSDFMLSSFCFKLVFDKFWIHNFFQVFSLNTNIFLRINFFQKCLKLGGFLYNSFSQ
jgi:hypothetical protein